MPVSDTYFSIADKSRGLYRDLGSRFIALAFPVETESEVKSIIDSIKREYHDARHHCYAYRCGHDGAVFRSSDDGEPSGSAGRQILGQIDSAGLSDILIVVVRYFGGIKLGIPGLICAYKSAARDAIGSALRREKVAGKFFCVSFGYLQMNEVMKVVKDLSLPVSDQQWDEVCTMKVRVRLSLEENFRERIAHISGAYLAES